MLHATLPDGPLDIVGDIHGEIAALEALLDRLGYRASASHPDGRHLLFLGDLTDRGPDSLAVVARVRELVLHGTATCLLGNHELNLVLDERKHGNHWFFGEPEALLPRGEIVPQALLSDPAQRAELLDFFRELPLVAEREDLLAVHACFDPAAIAAVREQAAAGTELETWYRQCEHTATGKPHGTPTGGPQSVDDELIEQNGNPVKVLTSGLEQRVETEFFAGGKTRRTDRVPWWRTYRGRAFCVFGHYWRIPVPGLGKLAHLFANDPHDAALGAGQSMCLDYSVGGRWRERLLPGFDGTFVTRLVALRWPEGLLVDDTGVTMPMRR